MNITMLGTSGVGKTTFMAGIGIKFYDNDCDGFRVDYRKEKDRSSFFAYRTFSEINKFFEGKFPEGTKKANKMDLCLLYNNKQMLDVDWIDYKGGTVNELLGQRDEDDVHTFRAVLLTSQILMVFVDSEYLADTENTNTLQRTTSAIEYTQLLREVTDDNVSILFVLSKFDSPIVQEKFSSKEVAFDQLAKRTKQIYASLMREKIGKGWNFKVIPVSVTGFNKTKVDVSTVGLKKEFTNTLINPDIEPYNVEAAFAFALYQAYSLEKKLLEKGMSSSQQKIDKLRVDGKLKLFFTKVFNHTRLVNLDYAKLEFEKQSRDLLALKSIEEALFKIWNGRVKDL